MKIINLGETNSALNNFIAEIRDTAIQKDSMRFRINLERIGAIFAYEISKILDYSPKDVTTPLGIAKCHTYDNEIVIASILRAGLPLHHGMLNVFDKSQNAFIAAYRKYGKDNKFTIQIEYTSSPGTENKTLILADTMLATGSSLVLTYNNLCDNNTPAHTHIVCPIASKDGIEYLSKHLPHKKVTLWVGAIDEELTIKSYIVPGLGDAGDLAYGSKI
ncbi:MAG: uracil phosphoribosyltransferase [Bacteroidia bacterium]|jgi:uracil phosphoribosyltransferase|nr:uracil phosphoribosyltransferase [Bacteroidales bacterium]MDD3300734.1 uracil phosphoribosyltransferase [Bacteroidales bacterium]MDD3843745.1 uracil phosphoribosyltransferase [Bacteroidales bacterium]MDD4618407.1 uracil phosphoribosyltransferase [Bacteroidales bacterium]NCC45476.1 uracil phosphoribosyltransferase [Bacteroidia bacterium]